ncbi:MAG: DUF1996 domain-containing protein [Rhodoglobus sp.]
MPAPHAQAVPDAPRAASTRVALVVGVVAIVALIAGVGIGLAAVAVSSTANAPHPAASATPAAVNTTGFPSGGTNSGIFTDTCKLVTTQPNDPILMPGMTGQSMQHDFFGNLAPSSTITPAALLGGASNCSTSADSSAYWTPVLYQNGTAIEPSSTLIYWRAPSTSASAVKTMPAGITLIAGNEGAMSPQDAHVVGWTCSAKQQTKLTSLPADCPKDTELRLIATFPNCWDGKNLDGSTQKNVVYATDDACPSSHPVQIPQVVMHVNYPTQSAANLTLSIGPTQQGSILTGHADFMSGWNQTVMDRNVAACIDTQTRCGPVAGAMAMPKGGKQRSS